MRPPFSYYGGKQRLAKQFIGLMPEHSIYVEVFGGSGAILFAKTPTAMEVYNDISGDLANFFRVLRNKEQAAELTQLLDLTPYSREERRLAYEERDSPSADPVEQARRFYVLVSQGFGGLVNATGWGFNRRPPSTHVRTYRNQIARFAEATARLTHVQVECRDFRFILSTYDAPGTLIYCDPPYINSTKHRSTDRYHHDMTDSDHQELVDLLLAYPQMAMVSGYSHPIYSLLVDAGWTECQWQSHASMAARTRATGMIGTGSAAHQVRTEVLWLNPAVVAAQAQQKLL